MLITIVSGCAGPSSDEQFVVEDIQREVEREEEIDRVEEVEGWCYFDSDCLAPCNYTYPPAYYGYSVCVLSYESNETVKSVEDVKEVASDYIKLRHNVSGEYVIQILNVSQSEDVRYMDNSYFWTVDYLFIGCESVCSKEIKNCDWLSNRDYCHTLVRDDRDIVYPFLLVYDTTIPDDLYISNDGKVYTVGKAGI